jgi:2EXR family
MDIISSTVPSLPPAQEKRREKPVEFSDLPAEIRLEIWKLATPKSRILRVKVEPTSTSATLFGPFSPVPTILHVCHESRHFGLTIFRRGFQDISDGLNDFYWNPSIDTVYLVLFHDGVEPPRPVEILSLCTEMIPDVQHLALPLTYWLYRSLATVDSPILSRLATFPSLHSICFLIQPLRDWFGQLQWLDENEARQTIELADGRHIKFYPPSAIVLYEPLETHIYGYGSENLPPSAIERHIVRVFDEFWNHTHQDAVPPTIEILIMGAKRFKNSGFCLSCPRNLEPWGIVKGVANA